MTESKKDESSDGTGLTNNRVRRALPKSKKLNNTQVLKNTPGGLGGGTAAANLNQTMPCPTPQQNLHTYCSLC